MRRYLLITYCLLSFLCLHGQNRIEGFDYAFKPTQWASRYYVSTEKMDSGWFRQAWYLPERSMAMEGWYKDSAATIPHGMEKWYHTSRYLKSSGSYVNGKKEGPWLKYDEEGNLTDTAFYTNGHLKGISYGFNAEGYVIDSFNFDGAGNGVQVSWYSGGTVRVAGRWVADTAKHGRWQYFHPNGQLQATEDYEYGKRTACNCYTEEGKPLDAKDCEDAEAIFTGGDKAWARYVQHNLHPDVPVRNGAPAGSYTVTVQFIVNTDGTLSDIKPKTQFGYGMEEEVVRLVKQAPRWQPARLLGRKVKAYRLQPVTFVISEGR